MNTKIFEFKKTHHFMFRQLERKIDDTILYTVLTYVQCTYYSKDIIIAYPSFLQRKGLSKDDFTSLVLIVKQKLLITCYWCDYLHVFKLLEKECFFSHFQELL